ncbi:hypothetical protein PV326_010156 [Microctonus aethiopoides]|nr:hypothetical protein PV326_010156 [Microctonus aethiopoides]
MEHDNAFVCTGKVNLNDFQLSKNGPLINGELEKIIYSDNVRYSIDEINVRLFDRTQPASTAVLHLDHLIKCMEMHLRILNRCEIHETLNLKPIKNDKIDLNYIRKSICDLVIYIRTYLDSIEPEWAIIQHSMLMNIQNEMDKVLVCIKKFLAKLKKLPGSVFHYAISNTGNKCGQPEFHLYHMHLDLRWLFVTVIYNTTKKKLFASDSMIDLNKTLELVVDDLIYISLKIFDRVNLSDLRNRSPFNCTCIRELWLMLEILIDDLHDRYNCQDFWYYVNTALNKIHKPKIEAKKNEKSSRMIWHGEADYSFTETRYPELFGIWIIYHLALLYGYNNQGYYIGTTSTRIKDNYIQIDKILKAFANDKGKEDIKDNIDEELKIIIPLLRVLTNEWWSPKIMVINYLWECFHRRLEQPFLMQLSGPWTISIEKKTPADILKQVKDRINGNLDHGNESSYGMFLRFLGEILKRGHESKDNKFWHQVKGRICSKFTKNKVKDFSESALINFISLFLTLAITTDAENVSAIMQDLLPPVQDSDLESTRCALLSWKGKLSILLVYVDNKLQLAPVSEKIIQTVNIISCRKDELAKMMMAIFVDTLNIVLSSNENLNCGEHCLIGGWIDRYLLECSRNRAGILLKMLLDVFNISRYINSCVQPHEINLPQYLGATKMLEALWSVVAGRVRTLVFDINSIGENYNVIAKLAAAFTLEALNNPIMAKNYRHSATSLFAHFTSTINVKDVRITKFYLGIILEDTSVVENLKGQLKNFDLLIIQAWIKCCVYGQDANDGEMRRIKSFIADLEEFKAIFPSWMDAHEFKESKESVLMYAMGLARRRNSIAESQKSSFDARVRMVFNHIDKWALIPIKDETKDSELAFWIYRCLGTFLLCCGAMFHTKNQMSPLKIYINKFILPTDEQMGFFKNLGKRIFSMVVLGFEAANPKSDVGLFNLLFDLFQNYLPLLITDNGGPSSFKISESLIRCFTDAKPDFINLIIERLSTGFLKISADNSMHTHSYLVMILFTSLIGAANTYPKYLIEFIISKCGMNIIECYIKVHDLHPHKKQTINFITKVVSNPYYKEDHSLRATFNGIISSISSNYLCYNSQAIFELLKSLTIIESSIVKFVIPHIEKIIIDAEKYHRPNAASLRFSLKQLEDLVIENTKIPIN